MLAKTKIDKKRQNNLSARAAILKAIAHPTRLFLVEELFNQDHCVCELTEMLAVDTSTVSKHLLILKNAGIVEDKKMGLKVYYKLKMPCVLNFISCIDTIMKENAKSQLDSLI